MSAIFNMPAWANNRSGDAAQLAAELNTPAAIRKMDLQTLFASIIGAAAEGDRQAVAADLGELWEVSGGRWIDRAESALLAGDLSGVQGLLATLPVSARTAVGAGTMGRIDNVIKAITVTAGAKFWNEEDGEIPDPFTAAWVTTTLTVRGYTWTGTEWARA